MRSLRQRAIIGGTIWAALTITVGGLALISLFDNLTLKRFDEGLRDRQFQVIVALNHSGANQDAVNQILNNPAYERPFSGSYWQAIGPDEMLLSSRSLFGATLAIPLLPTTTREFWEGPGPAGNIRGLVQQISLEDGSTWAVAVAQSLTPLEADRSQVRRGLMATFALLGVLGIAGSILQIATVVRPLTKLRHDISHRWDSEEDLEPEAYPEEVAPLVSDMNMLLHRNHEMIKRARRGAADLAHALKTPSAVLRNELSTLQQRGEDVGQAQEALSKIDAQIVRSLARIRAGNSASGIHARTNITSAVERMARLFNAMPEYSAKTLTTRVDDDLATRMDPHDLEEILGNILENAFTWASKRVSLELDRDETGARIEISDDGPGISEENRREALRSGGRLDVSTPGTGLGLAIAADLLQAYGGELDLGVSQELGGLKVTLHLPA